jgi:tetratricopeptide (TPR) repeat protein
MGETAPDSQPAQAKAQRLFEQGQFQEAAAQFSAAQRAYTQAGDSLKAAEMLNNVGVAYRRARKHQQAVGALEEARQIFSHLGDRTREAQTLGNLGALYSKMKRYGEAAASYQQAVDLFQDLDDRAQQSETLRAMAIMQFKRGQRSKAMLTYEDALYYLPHPNLLQRLARFLLKMRGWILRFTPTR